ncbi:MAG: hypothetical protein WB424_01060 [Terracidiphilus sp.]
MKSTMLSVLLLLASATALAATIPNLTGSWTVHNSIAGNESEMECKFVQTEAKLTGSCKGQDKEVQITGSIDGNKLTWKYDSDFNGTPITLTYVATLDDSGKIAGSVNVDPFGVSGDFTAVPSKVAAQ